MRSMGSVLNIFVDGYALDPVLVACECLLGIWVAVSAYFGWRIAAHPLEIFVGVVSLEVWLSTTISRQSWDHKQSSRSSEKTA